MWSPDFSWVTSVSHKRLDWLPGDPWAKARITIREGIPGDLRIICQRLKLQSTTVYKYLSSHGYTCYVADRSGRNIVGIVLAKHKDNKNVITHWWASERYETPEFMTKMLVLIALEQPEVRTEIEVDVNDVHTTSIARAIGWKITGISEETNIFSCDPRQPIAQELIEQPSQPQVTQ